MYKIKLTPTAVSSFNNLHPEVRKQLKIALNSLKENPYYGKQLREELIDFRTFKIKRYRIIYQVNNNLQHIIVVALGHRKDIYEIATKLMQQDDK